MNDFFNAVKESVKYWWFSLVIGVLALIVGVWSITAPIATIGVLTIFFVASLLVSGLFDIFFSLSNRKSLDGWGWTLAMGIISVIFSFILLSRPIESMLVLVTLAGFWVMFASITSISGSLEMQRVGMKNWGWLLAFGILGIILSMFLIINPVFAGSFVIGMFAFSMIAYGCVRIFYALQARKINKHLKEREK